MTPTERNACYNARRIIRAKNPAAFARKLRLDQDAFTMRLVETLPALLKTECIAAAEAKAVEQCGGSKDHIHFD